MFGLDSIEFWVSAYAVVLSIFEGVASTKKLQRLWRTRDLRRIWGIKDGDTVTVVCSELDNPVERQHDEAREFIYSYKYGDLDAYFEVLVTLFMLYPTIKLQVMSAGEVEHARLNLSSHLILIGGPDYNVVASQVLTWGTAQFEYRSPYVTHKSDQYPDEIVIVDKVSDKEYCFQDDTRDFGYLERIVNCHSPEHRVILVGGCHTIGVTGAVKAFSMASSEYGAIPRGVLKNAALVAKKIGKAKNFSVLVSVEKIGQVISTPVVKEGDVTVRAD